MNLRYSLAIRRSVEDQAYLVALPELDGDGRYATHGGTYEEALKNGLEVMEMLADSFADEGRPLPEPDVISPSPVG